MSDKGVNGRGIHEQWEELKTQNAPGEGKKAVEKFLGSAVG